jgi:ABC-type oligopeptide transport system substrate-binding subunit
MATRIARVAAGLTVCLALIAVTGPAQGPKRGGIYRATLGADPPTLDPAEATDTTSSAILRQVFDGLVELNERVQPTSAATG